MRVRVHLVSQGFMSVHDKVIGALRQGKTVRIAWRTGWHASCFASPCMKSGLQLSVVAASA